MAVKPMSKSELVSRIADETGLEKKASERALDCLINIITTEVSKGGAVSLPGVGKFYRRDRAARMVRNPSTGEQIKKPADKVAKFTVAKALKESVNG